MESNEARAARLTRDATRVTRRRAAETDEERTARLADNTESEARRRAAETDEERMPQSSRRLRERRNGLCGCLKVFLGGFCFCCFFFFCT